MILTWQTNTNNGFIVNIRRKFAISIAAVCGISVLSTVCLWQYEKHNAEIVAQKKGKEMSASIEKILALKSGYYRKQANDYAYWNDLVKYTNTRDARWARDNLDEGLTEFGSNGIYIIDTQKNIIYSAFDRAFLKDPYTVIEKEYFNPKETREIHFFAKTKHGIVEFFGSPIRYSTGKQKTTHPHGYLIVAKHWDHKYIDEIKDIGQVEAKIEEIGDKHDISSGIISKDIPLKDINDKQIGNLHISMQNDVAKTIDGYAKNTLTIALVHVFIVVIAFVLLMRRYFNSPLHDISNALKEKNISPIEKYLPQKNEYGDISRAINDSFESKVQLKELNRQLERRVQEELEKNRHKDKILFQQSKIAALGEMISLIAHQWRQPLNAVGLIMQNAYHDYKSGILTEKDIEECNTKGMALIRSMSKTIDGFRNFFTPDETKQMFCIEDSIDSSLSIISALLDSANIKVICNYNGKHAISGYKNDFEQTILNLLLNAKEAIESKDGSTGGHIEIAINEKNGGIVVKLSDSGCGIANDVIEKIFDPYFTTKYQAQGVGLGLYMAKQTIEKHHGGKIHAENTIHGACFVIELPQYS